MTSPGSPRVGCSCASPVPAINIALSLSDVVTVSKLNSKTLWGLSFGAGLELQCDRLFALGEELHELVELLSGFASATRPPTNSSCRR